MKRLWDSPHALAAGILIWTIFRNARPVVIQISFGSFPVLVTRDDKDKEPCFCKTSTVSARCFLAWVTASVKSWISSWEYPNRNRILFLSGTLRSKAVPRLLSPRQYSYKSKFRIVVLNGVHPIWIGAPAEHPGLSPSSMGYSWIVMLSPNFTSFDAILRYRRDGMCRERSITIFCTQREKQLLLESSNKFFFYINA